MELRRRLRVGSTILLATALQLIAAVFGVATLLAPQAASASPVTSIPYLINFQGRLTDNSGNILSDGSYNVKFRIFDALTSGTNRWEGDRVRGVSDHRITVTNGLFNIQFGDTSQGDPSLDPATTPLFNTNTYANLYLEVELPTPATATCATNGCAVFSEGAMTPRQPLASSPYAFNSDKLDGLDSTDFGQLSAANTFTGANLFAPTTASTVALTVKATTAGSTNSLEVFDSGGTRQAFIDANGVFNDIKGITVSGGVASLNDSSNNATNIGTGSSNALVSIGGGSGTFALNTTTIDISAGAVTGVTGLSLTSGNISQAGSGTLSTGTGAVSLNGATTVSTTSTNAFQVQNAGAGQLFNLNTSNMSLAVNGDSLTVVNLSAAATPGVAAGANTGGTLSGAAATTYFYKVTALNSLGETTASSEVSINGQSFTPIAAPGALTAALGSNGGATGVGVYSYKVTFVTANGETSGGTTSNTCTTTSTKKECDLSAVPLGPAGTTARRIYRTTVGGSSYFLVPTGATFSNNTTTTLTGEGNADGTLTTAIPVANTATVDTNNATVTWTTVAGATSYRVYRGTATGVEDHYQAAASSPFTDTGATGTAASPPSSATAGQVGIGTATPSANFDVEGTGLFKNGSDSLAAFQIQNAAATVLLVADTTDSKLVVGSATTDTTQILLQLDSLSNYADGGGCSTTINQGALYYNTNTNAIRTCVNAAWEDVMTTAGMGILAFGVVADTGATPGDIANKSSAAAAAGPCKVGWASTTSVTVTACSAYSSGRKTVVAPVTLTGVVNTATTWTHVCISSATGQPALDTGATTEVGGFGGSFAFSAASPVLCLADIVGTGGAIQIYDTRVFTHTQKSFVFTAAAMPLGSVARDNSGTTASTVALPGTVAIGALKGVIVSTTGAAWAAGGPNAIIAYGGPAYVKSSAGVLATASTAQNSTATNGYALIAAASATAYANLGLVETARITTCSNGANCNLSLLVDLDIK